MKTATTETAILLILSHLPKLFQFHDLIIFGPSVSIAEIVDKTILTLVVAIFAFGHLGMSLDFIQHDFYEGTRFIIVEISELDACL